MQETSSVPADSTALELIKAPEPDYPLEAAAKRVQGKVVLQLHISETGDVENTDVVSGEPILAAAAEKGHEDLEIQALCQEWKTCSGQ